MRDGSRKNHVCAAKDNGVKPPMASIHPVQSDNRPREGSVARWHPAEISDRELIELRSRLEMVQRLGGPFAMIDFSDDARRRLKTLDVT